MSKKTILDYLTHHAEGRPYDIACLVKENGKYAPVSWQQLHTSVGKIASYLIAQGVRPGDRVALLSPTSYPAMLSDLAIGMAGAVSVPIYQSNLAEECAYIVENSGSEVVITADREQTQKILQSQSIAAQVRLIVQIEGELFDEHPKVKSFAQALQHHVDTPKIREILRQLGSDDLLCIIYTSGTTGLPKGVMLSHDNMIYEAEAIAAIHLLFTSDIQLLFLPLAHVFAKALQVSWLATGHCLAIAESIHTLRSDLLLVRPTVMAGVPRIFEKFYTNAMGQATKQKGLLSYLFEQALHSSEAMLTCEQNHIQPSRLQTWRHRFFQKTVFKKVGAALKAAMGGRMRLLVSGGAPLSGKIGQFFADCGITLVEGFGLTETSAATLVNRPNHNRIGSVGQPLPGTMIKLAEDGELLISGRGICKGYWRDPQKTAESMVDQYFATGDIARIDEQGFVYIVDRKKDLIITAGGKNVAPQKIENLLKTAKLISQIVVHGDKRNYLTALITLDAELLGDFAKEKHLQEKNYGALSNHPEVVQEVTRIVGNFNHQLPQYETIKKFRILDHDFSIESGELTPSLKVKRREINTRYKSLFDSLYEDHF